MDIIGLLFEFVFLAFGIGVYLYAIGKYRPAGTEARQQAEAFRVKNHWWLRLGSLLLVALMAVNIYLHIVDLMGS